MISESALSTTLGDLFDICKEGMMVIAMRDGAMTSVSDVPSGLACECTCPCCERRLVARKGKRKAHHFAHQASRSDTSCNYAAETILHQFAKLVIDEERRIGIPPTVIQDEYGPLQVADAKTVTLDKVALERRFRDIVPDVACWSGDRMLLVEFFVTNKCSDRKIEKLKAMGLSVMEVDLSKYRHYTLNMLRQVILTEAPRIMLVNRYSDSAISELLTRKQKMDSQLDELADDHLSALRQLKWAAIDANAKKKTFESTYLKRVLRSPNPPLAYFLVSEPVWKSEVLSLIFRDKRKKWSLPSLMEELRKTIILTEADDALFNPIISHLLSRHGVTAVRAEMAVKDFINQLEADRYLSRDTLDRVAPTKSLTNPNPVTPDFYW